MNSTQVSNWQDFLIPESPGFWKLYDSWILDERASITDPPSRVRDRAQYTGHPGAELDWI